MTDRATVIEQAKLIKALIALGEADIIMNTFVYAFMNKTIDKGNGTVYLHGNFNLNNKYVIKHNNQCDDNIKMIALVLCIWQLHILLQGFIRVILCRKSSKQGNSYW